MSPDDFSHQRNALVCRNVGKTNKSRMANTPQMDELAEIGVDRYEDPIFRFRVFQESRIAGIGTKFARFDDIMRPLAQSLGKLFAGAPIDEESHD